MYWAETSDKHDDFVVPTDVIDLSFRIRCQRLPVDHAWPLGEAIHRHLQWLPGEALAGIHLVHGAESGNGWYRPGGAEYLELPRRSRLTLRIPRHRLEDAATLAGARLRIADCDIEVGEPREKPLTASSTVFSRHVRAVPAASEAAFLQSIFDTLADLGVVPSKMLCGKLHAFRSPDGPVHARSVMIADLRLDESVTLQQHGIGDLRAFGFGMFLPHKGIDAVFRQAGE